MNILMKKQINLFHLIKNYILLYYLLIILKNIQVGKITIYPNKNYSNISQDSIINLCNSSGYIILSNFKHKNQF